VKSSRFAVLLCALVACSTFAVSARAARVDLSLNVFPTSLANPNSGGTWRIVAKTDAPLGIAAISAFLTNVNVPGLAVESDINHQPSQPVYIGTFSGLVNILYTQDILSGPIVTGVGRPPFSDGPDPFGNPLWNGATRIFSGTYNAQVPGFGSVGNSSTDANVLIFTTPGNPAQDADVTTVVRFIPEPAAILIAAPALALAATRRTRRG
jgi:hypothetical protein